jgi:hypothetical protein
MFSCDDDCRICSIHCGLPPFAPSKEPKPSVEEVATSRYGAIFPTVMVALLATSKEIDVALVERLAQVSNVQGQACAHVIYESEDGSETGWMRSDTWNTKVFQLTQTVVSKLRVVSTFYASDWSEASDIFAAWHWRREKAAKGGARRP